MAKHHRALTALGRNIREKRVALGFSQQLLARKSRLGRSYISDIERGIHDPSLLCVRRIAKGLGSSTAALLEGFDR